MGIKRILLVCFLYISMEFSFLFAARVSGMDLREIFSENQLGLGYNSGQLQTSLYSDFGTDFFRFSINVLELGGSLFNNVSIASNIYTNVTQDDNYTPFLQGIPRFFAGIGFDTYYMKIAIGYGLKMDMTNGYFRLSSSGFIDNSNPPGIVDTPLAMFSVLGTSLYAHDASIYLEIPIDEYNSIEIGGPLQLGMIRKDSYALADVYNGAGKSVGNFVFKYDNKNIFSLCTSPQFVWNGYLGYLRRIRLIVPFSIYQAKEANYDDKDIAEMVSSVDGPYRDNYDDIYLKVRGYTAKIPEKDNKAIGAALELFFTFLEDDYLSVSFLPKVTFAYAMSGNDFSTSTVMGKQSRVNDANISIDDIISGGYNLEEPWALKLSLPIRIATEGEVVSIWVEPRFDLYFVDSSYTTIGPKMNLRVREEPFLGLGYLLPIELTLNLNDSLHFKLGLEAQGSTPLYGEPSKLSAKVDGGVIWYF